MFKYLEYEKHPIFPGTFKRPCKFTELPLLGGKCNFKRILLHCEPLKSPYTQQSTSSKETSPQLQGLINAFGELNLHTLVRLLDFLQAEGTLTPHMLCYLQELLLKAGGDLTPHQLAMILNVLERTAAENNNSAGSVAKVKRIATQEWIKEVLQSSLTMGKSTGGRSSRNNPCDLTGSQARGSAAKTQRTRTSGNNNREGFDALADHHSVKKAKKNRDMKSNKSAGASAFGTGASGAIEGGILGNSYDLGPFGTKYKPQKGGRRRDSNKWNAVVTRSKVKKDGGVDSNENHSSIFVSVNASRSKKRAGINRSQNRGAKGVKASKSKKVEEINGSKSHGILDSSFANRAKNAEGPDCSSNLGVGGGASAPYESVETHRVPSEMKGQSGYKCEMFGRRSKASADENHFVQETPASPDKVPYDMTGIQNIPGVKDKETGSLRRSTSAAIGIDSIGGKRLLYYKPWDVNNFYKDLRAFNHLAKNARKRRLPRHASKDYVEIEPSQIRPSTASSKISKHANFALKASGSVKEQSRKH